MAPIYYSLEAIGHQADGRPGDVRLVRHGIDVAVGRPGRHLRGSRRRVRNSLDSAQSLSVPPALRVLRSERQAVSVIDGGMAKLYRIESVGDD